MKVGSRLGLGRYSDVESTFIAAALGNCTWQDAMAAVATASKSHGSVLFSLTSRPSPPSASVNLVEASNYYIKQGWNKLDERFRGLSALKQRGVTTDFDFTDLDSMERSPFYQEFLRRFGLRWFAGVKIDNGNDLWSLAIQRSSTQDPFSDVEQRRLARWSKRLSTAAALERVVGEARALGAVDALDAVGAAAILLDGNSRAIRVNRAAEGLFCKAFTVRNGVIVVTGAQSATDLQKALGRLFDRHLGNAVSDPVVIERDDRRPLTLRLVRFDPDANTPFSPCRAIALIDDLSASRRVSSGPLRTIYGLTEAEAAVAASIGEGHDLDATATALGIGKETARSQLKSVFAKTGTRRQAELVVLVSRFTHFRGSR